MPFSLFEFWFFRGPIDEILISFLPLLCVGLIISVISLVSSRRYPKMPISVDTKSLITTSAIISGFAGIVEELVFRWIVFYSITVTVQLANWLFFGFLGFGIPEWLYVNIIGPVANFATFGALGIYLLNGFGWAVGSAIVSSNGRFRNAHTQYKIIGLIFVWYAGIYFFWVMFRYGIFASMALHFLYDFIVITMGALYVKRKQSRYPRLTRFYPRRRTY